MDNHRQTAWKRKLKLVVVFAAAILWDVPLASFSGALPVHAANLRAPDVELLELDLEDSAPDFFEIRRIPEFVRRAKETFPEQLAAIEERLRDR